MRILVSCPHCRIRARLKLELLGRLLLCTHCLQPFTSSVETSTGSKTLKA